jgi:adenylate cyclase
LLASVELLSLPLTSRAFLPSSANLSTISLTETWRRWDHDIGFGIGIAHGFATLGTIGFEGRFDYAAIGTVSNVASRLCDEAKPGQILISPRVLMAIKDAVTVEAVGELELKGIRRPIAAYNVLSTASPNA